MTAPASVGSRSLVVSLHDVSPHTRAASATILGELEELGVRQASLLVIPDHHHRGHILADAEFGTWLCAQAAAGHEPVLHGYYHRRSRQPRETLREKLTTRIYTADEGEFFDLDRTQATALVKKGRRDFQRLGLDPTGFIAPAWLLGPEAEMALRDLHFSYTTRLGGILDLRTGEIHRSQSLVWSVRSGWRRATSLAWNALLFQRLAAASLLRISIHPVDRQHGRVWQQIRELVAHALADREPLTYERWLARLPAATSP